jgi:hypothetical protein
MQIETEIANKSALLATVIGENSSLVTTKDILTRVTFSKLITRNFDKRTIRLKLNDMTEKGILISKSKKGTYNQYTIANYKYEVNGDYFIRINPF